MGFGHRVYKNYDPRARIMQKTTHEVLNELGIKDDPLLDVAIELEQIALKDEYFIEKKLYPNIDFYSGITLKAMGFPTSMFTVLFALARTVGWIAQWKEMIEDPSQKIGRPRQLYVGAPQRDYLTIAPARAEAPEHAELEERGRAAPLHVAAAPAQNRLDDPRRPLARRLVADAHQRVEPARRRPPERRRSGVSERSGSSASASFSGVQSHWMSSGIDVLAEHQVGEHDRAAP